MPRGIFREPEQKEQIRVSWWLVGCPIKQRVGEALIAKLS